MSHPLAIVCAHDGGHATAQPNHPKATRAHHSRSGPSRRALGRRDPEPAPEADLGRDPPRRVRSGGRSTVVGAGRAGDIAVGGTGRLGVASNRGPPVGRSTHRAARVDRGAHGTRAPRDARWRRGPPFGRAVRCGPDHSSRHPVCERSASACRRGSLPLARAARARCRRLAAPQALHARRHSTMRGAAACGPGTSPEGHAPSARGPLAWVRPRRERPRDARRPGDRKGRASAADPATPHAARRQAGPDRPRIPRAEDRDRGGLVGVPRPGSVTVRLRSHPPRRAHPPSMDTVHLHVRDVRRVHGDQHAHAARARGRRD